MAYLDPEMPRSRPVPVEAAPSREAGERPLSTLPRAEPSTIVSDELSRIRSTVQSLSPADAAIGFEYDGRLRINIDVRFVEDVARLETLLPSACDGLFFNIQRRLVEHHPFLHRLTASVAR
jgi:hypothetical protein